MEGLENFNGTKRYVKKDKRYCNHSTTNMHHYNEYASSAKTTIPKIFINSITSR